MCPRAEEQAQSSENTLLRGGEDVDVSEGGGTGTNSEIVSTLVHSLWK
jgi:hypothetical protein